MAVGIGIWLALLGYAVAWSGWQNLGITYSPQTDGSVVPSSASTTLLDAFLCRSPGPAAGQEGPAPSSSSVGSETPSPTPAPVPQPGGILGPIAVLQPAPTPAPAQLPGFPHPPSGVPQPGVSGILTTILHGVESLVEPVLLGLRL